MHYRQCTTFPHYKRDGNIRAACSNSILFEAPLVNNDRATNSSSASVETFGAGVF